MAARRSARVGTELVHEGRGTGDAGRGNAELIGSKISPVRPPSPVPRPPSLEVDSSLASEEIPMLRHAISWLPALLATTGLLAQAAKRQPEPSGPPPLVASELLGQLRYRHIGPE